MSAQQQDVTGQPVEDIQLRWGQPPEGAVLGLSWTAGGFVNEITLRGREIEFRDGPGGPADDPEVILVSESAGRDGIRVILVQKGRDRIVLTARQVTITEVA